MLLLGAFIGSLTALLQLAVATQLAALLELPRSLLIESGLFLLGWVLLLGVLATRARLPAAWV